MFGRSAAADIDMAQQSSQPNNPDSVTGEVIDVSVDPPGKRRQKRVGRACESCRRKRLKCTANAHPCMNCLLYKTECLYSSNPAKRRGGRQRKGDQARAGPSSPSPTSQQQSTAQDANRPEEDRDEPDCAGGFPSPPTDATASSAQGYVGSEAFLSFPISPMLSQPLYLGQSGQIGMDEAPSIGFDGANPMAEMFNEATPRHVASPRQSDWERATLPPGNSSEFDQLSRDESESGKSCHFPSGRVTGLYCFAHNSELLSEGAEHGQLGLSIWKDTEDWKYIGAMSTGAIVSSGLTELVKSQQGLKESAVDYLIGAVKHVDEVEIRSCLSYIDYKLPEQSLAASFADAYFRNVHVVYPILDCHRFRNEWPGLYNSSVTSQNPIVMSRLYLVLAIGILNENLGSKLDPARETLSKELYQRAWEMLQDVIAQPYIASVQVLALHVIYLFHHSKSGIAWVLCGLAVRIGQSLGLHRRNNADPSLEAATKQLRSQLWWTCYALDAHLSATQGRLPAMHDCLCDADILVSDSGNLSPSERVSSDICIWHTGLARIKNRICFLFNDPNTGTSLVDNVSKLDEDLIGWRDSIPLEYRPEQEILAAREYYSPVAMLHLLYFNTMYTLHWTLLVSAGKQKISLAEHKRPRIRASEAICIAAARSFIKILNDISSELNEERLPPIYIHTDHYMAAISVLFGSIFKYPRRISARTDLEFLRAGHYHFERHVNPQRLNPQLRGLFQKIQTAAERVVRGAVTLQLHPSNDHLMQDGAPHSPPLSDQRNSPFDPNAITPGALSSIMFPPTELMSAFGGMPDMQNIGSGLQEVPL